MGCNCKNKDINKIESTEEKNNGFLSGFKNYTGRIILFIIIVPFIIPISVTTLFYVLIIKQGNIDGFVLMKTISKVLKNALKNDNEEDDDEEIFENISEEEFNEENYELDIIN